MTPELRQYFDERFDNVLPQLPERVHELLDEVTMYVEDYPSPEILQKMGVRRREGLCGLYSGIPLDKRSVGQSGVLSDAIYIYREGVLAMSTDHRGGIDEDELRRQIRITVLHELGHHFGLDEDDLRELGYG